MTQELWPHTIYTPSSIYMKRRESRGGDQQWHICLRFCQRKPWDGATSFIQVCFSVDRSTKTSEPIFTVCSSKDAFSAKKVTFGGLDLIKLYQGGRNFQNAEFMDRNYTLEYPVNDELLRLFNSYLFEHLANELSVRSYPQWPLTVPRILKCS